VRPQCRCGPRQTHCGSGTRPELQTEGQTTSPNQYLDDKRGLGADVVRTVRWLIRKKNIKPDDAFQEKNHMTIYDINYEKSSKNNVELDIHICDKVRILQKKNQFQKGKEARYSDDVYTVKKVNGKSITLSNNEVITEHHY
jgi:hypothetical protein